jgi:hypothetical protein
MQNRALSVHFLRYAMERHLALPPLLIDWHGLRARD